MLYEVITRGLYLWGGVGRGKTWLMDLFCSVYRDLGIERHHFHSFMRQMHEALRHLEGRSAPLDLVVGEMAKRFRVLCLDEFHVIDIGDAMLLRGLLEALERAGVTLVTTSNQPPDNLYLGGIQRDSFLPAIEVLKRCNRVMELAGERDYRLQLFEASSVYHTVITSYSIHYTKLYEAKGTMRVRSRPSCRSVEMRDCCSSRVSVSRCRSDSDSLMLPRSLTVSASALESCWMVEKRSISRGSNSAFSRSSS